MSLKRKSNQDTENTTKDEPLMVKKDVRGTYLPPQCNIAVNLAILH
jgi:hypothetical protein